MNEVYLSCRYIAYMHLKCFIQDRLQYSCCWNDPSQYTGQGGVEPVLSSMFLTSVSASMNTHLLYCVRVQQCSLVKVTPRSGRFIRARWAASPDSMTSTTHTSSKMARSASLQHTHKHTMYINVQVRESVCLPVNDRGRDRTMANDTSGLVLPAGFCYMRSYECDQFPGCVVVS